MAKELLNSTGGYYYTNGRRVLRAPVHNEYADGSKGSQMGFEVCECNKWVDGAAETVAEALNAFEHITPPADVNK